MSTGVTAPARRRSGSASGIDLYRWPALARLQARTSRRRLLLWPLLITFLVGSTAYAIPSFYDTVAKRAAYAATAGDSASTRAFNGRDYGLDTVGGIVAYELGFYALLVFPAIALHLAIHLTRTQESAGRFELLTAGRMGRTAPLASSVVLLAGSLGLASSGTLATLLAAGLPALDSLWYAASLLVLMVVFAAVGLLVAQVAQDSHGAHTLGMGVLFALFLVRAVVDARLWDAWVTPLGWFVEVRPFTDHRVAPLAALVALSAVLFAAAVLLNVRRDLDGGLLAPRAGSPVASTALGTVPGLILRLTRGLWIAWTTATVIWAFFLGVLAPEMRQLVESNPDMERILGAQGQTPEELMLTVGAYFSALTVLGALVHALTRLAAEETSGRLSVVLATPVSRGRWWSQSLGLVGLASALSLALGGLAMGIGAAIGVGDSAYVGRGVAWVLTYLTPVLLCGAATALLASVRAPLAYAGWAIFGSVMTIEMLGEALRLPDWVLNLSPLRHVGRPPGDPVELGGIVVCGVAAVVVLGLSALLLRRRDLAR